MLLTLLAAFALALFAIVAGGGGGSLDKWIGYAFAEDTVVGLCLWTEWHHWSQDAVAINCLRYARGLLGRASPPQPGNWFAFVNWHGGSGDFASILVTWKPMIDTGDVVDVPWNRVPPLTV